MDDLVHEKGLSMNRFQPVRTLGETVADGLAARGQHFLEVIKQAGAQNGIGDSSFFLQAEKKCPHPAAVENLALPGHIIESTLLPSLGVTPCGFGCGAVRRGRGRTAGGLFLSCGFARIPSRGCLVGICVHMCQMPPIFL